MHTKTMTFSPSDNYLPAVIALAVLLFVGIKVAAVVMWVKMKRAGTISNFYKIAILVIFLL